MTLTEGTYTTGSVVGGGGGTEPPPTSNSDLRLRTYPTGATGTSYGAWPGGAPLIVSTANHKCYYYSDATMHGGQAFIRMKRLDQNGVEVEDISIWSDPDKSRRDITVDYYIDEITGYQIHEIHYVEHDMTVTDPVDHDPIWGMLGMGWLIRRYHATTGAFISETDHPGEFPDAGEPDYANFGRITNEHSTTGRRWKMSYGVSAAGRGILATSDNKGAWTLLDAFGFVSEDSEGALAIKEGSNNTNTHLFYFCRNNSDKIDFWMSHDGGTTFPVHLQIPFTSSKWVAPDCFVRPDNGNIVVIITAREATQYYVSAIEFDPDVLVTLTSSDDIMDAVLSVRNLYESNITSRPFASTNRPANYGYFVAILPPVGHADRNDPTKWLIMGYDESPRQTTDDSTAFVPVICDAIAFPYEDKARVKAYSTVNQTLPNGETKFMFGATSLDTLGEMDTTTGRWTCKQAGSRTVCFNMPRTNNNGATITVEARKYLAATPNTFNSNVGTYTETDGLSGTVGKLQFYFSATFALGDVMDFYAVVSGASSSPVSNNQVVPAQLTAGGGGLSYAVDITNATPITGGVKVKIASAAQSFSNTVPGLIDGAEVMDTHNAWSAGVFTSPETSIFKITFEVDVDNATSPRATFEVANYEVGQGGQNVRKKILFAVENRNRGGASTKTKHVFYYKINKDEMVKFWFTPYGANATTLSGAFNTIEIEQV